MEFHFGDQILKRYKGRFDAISTLSDVTVTNTSTGESIQISDSTEMGKLSPGIYRIDVSYQEGYGKKLFTVNGESFKSGDTFKLNFGDNLNIISEGMEKVVLNYIFSGTSLKEYTGSEADIVIPTSYSITDEREVDRQYTNFNTIYSDARGYGEYLPIPFKINNTLNITNSWSVYSNRDQIEEWIAQDGFVTVTYTDRTYIKGYDYQVKTILTSAFNAANTINSVVIPEGIEKVEIRAFQNCSNLTSITVESDNTIVDTESFDNCNSLYRITDGVKYVYNDLDGLPYIVYNMSAATVADLRILDGTKMINGSASANSIVESIYFPSSVTQADDYHIFYKWTALKTIDIEDSHIESIKSSNWIEGCSALKNFYVSKNLKNFDYTYAFYVLFGANSTPSLNLLSVGDIGRYLGNKAGEPLVLVTWSGSGNITLPDTCYLMSSNFSRRLSSGSNLEKINYDIKKFIHNGTMKVIPGSAFANCRSLSTVTLKEGLEKIVNNAFSYCTTLYSLTLPNSLTTLEGIGYSCGLKSLNIPSGIMNIAGDVFYGMNVSTLTVDDANPKFSDENSNIVFEKSTNTLVVGCSGSTIPSYTKILGEKCFSNVDLSSMPTLPEGLKRIEKNVFFYTDITNYSTLTVTIPDSVEYIGSLPCVNTVVIGSGVKEMDATDGGNDSRIKYIVMKSSEPPTILSTTFNWTSLTSITVPKGSLSKYQSATNWATHADLFIEAE